MGLSHIKSYCLEGGPEQDNANHIQMLTDDYEYFMEQKWYSFQNPILFDPKKLIFLYPNYKEEQLQLVTRWIATIDIKNIEFGESRNQEECLSTRWKYAIKRGVPIRYYRIIISVIFNKTFNSAIVNLERAKAQTKMCQSLSLFGRQGPCHQKILIGAFLNDKGYQVLRELICLIKKKRGESFYNKYISHLAALMLLFFNQAECYELLSTMLEESVNMSKPRLQSMRWHLVFREEQMRFIATSFYSMVGINSPTVAAISRHLDKSNVNKIQLFCTIVDNFFFGYLPLPFILRIFIIFLNEGVKIFLRIFYVLFVYCQHELKTVTSVSKAALVIKRKCLVLSTKQIKIMLKKSYNLNLSSIVSTRLVQERLKRFQSDRKYHYLPFIDGTSHILSFQDLEQIWSFLPFQLKCYDMKLVYPTEDVKPDQTSLKEMIRALQSPQVERIEHRRGESLMKEQRARFSLIVVKTLTNNSVNVFGVFILGNLTWQETKNQWYGNKQNFVFTLHPTCKKYQYTRQNNNFILTGPKSIQFGLSEKGSALLLDEKLDKGQTFSSNTYRNQPLNGGVQGQFEIDWIEAFSLY